MAVGKFDGDAFAIGGADQYFGAGSEFVRACLFIIAELEHRNREEIEREANAWKNERRRRITSNRNVLIADQIHFRVQWKEDDYGV